MKASSLIIIMCWLKPVFGGFDYPAYSARNAALANSYIASTSAFDAFILNPALSINSKFFYSALNYSQLFNLKELAYANGLIVLPVKSNAFAFSVINFGNTLYKENKFTFNVSKSFYNNRLSFGISFQVYNISVARYGSSSTFGFDFGFRYQILPNMHFAGTIENINQPKLNGFREEIPQALQLGLQYQPSDNITTHIKIQKDSWYSPETSISAEYKIFDDLELYSGYSTLATAPSFGILMKASKIEISYGMQFHFDLGATHFVGVAFKAKK